MSKRPWLNRETFGWAMFDFANQSFTLVILTTMFQLYFVNEIVEDDPSRGRQLWATAGIISLLIIVAIAPILGALADFTGAKKKLLFVTYLGCILFTALLALATPGAVGLAMTLFIIGYVFYATGENFMAAFLPELAEHRHMGKVSAFGFTLGYTGGLLCLAGAAVITVLSPGVTGYRLICLWAALFFLGSGIPTFVLLRERKQREEMPSGQTIVTVGFHRLAATFRSIRQYRQLFRYLAIMTFYLSGMQIIIWFAATIARELFGLGDDQLAIYILVLTVTSIIGAFCTGRFQDRLGTKNTIMLALVLWLIVMVSTAFIPQNGGSGGAAAAGGGGADDPGSAGGVAPFMFWVLGSGIGFGMGALGTSSRTLVGLFSPKHKAAEFFGFYGLASKGAVILGLSVTIVAERLFPDQYNMVVASGSIFFIVGLVLMFSVSEKEGRITALRATRTHQRRCHDILE